MILFYGMARRVIRSHHRWPHFRLTPTCSGASANLSYISDFITIIIIIKSILAARINVMEVTRVLRSGCCQQRQARRLAASHPSSSLCHHHHHRRHLVAGTYGTSENIAVSMIWRRCCVAHTTDFFCLGSVSAPIGRWQPVGGTKNTNIYVWSSSVLYIWSGSLERFVVWATWPVHLTWLF